jgi:hypothetical protein
MAGTETETRRKRPRLADADMGDVQAELARGASAEELEAFLAGRGYAQADAEAIAARVHRRYRDEIEKAELRQSLAIDREDRAPAIDPPSARRGGGLRGIGNILIGAVMVIGGASGSLVLKGTNSSGALAVFGVVLIIVGVVRMSSR